MISAGVAHTHTGSIEPWITRTTRATTQYRWQAANNFGTLCINRIHIGIHRCHWRCGRSLRYARNAASRDTSSASFPMEDIRLFCSILLLHIRFFYCQREPQQQHVVCRTKKYGDCDSIQSTQTTYPILFRTLLLWRIFARAINKMPVFCFTIFVYHILFYLLFYKCLLFGCIHNITFMTKHKKRRNRKQFYFFSVYTTTNQHFGIYI